MQRNNMEQLQHERQRAEALEESNRLYKLRENELTTNLSNCRHDLERLQAEVSG